jgi:hypothetical protein
MPQTCSLALYGSLSSLASTAVVRDGTCGTCPEFVLFFKKPIALAPKLYVGTLRGMMRPRAGLALVALQTCLAVMRNPTTINDRDERLLWSGVACSANCETIVGVVGGYRGAAGRIYVSNDAGGSWTAGTVVRSWRAVALSDDGGRMVAVEDSSDERKGGFIYTSNDGGSTWSTRYGAGCRHWISVSSSADGSRVFAVVGGYTGDFI